MGLPVTAKQDEVSGIPIPKLRAFYEAIGDGPVVLDLEAFVEWQGKGTRATGYIGPFSLMGERKERLTRKYSIQYDDWAEMPGCDDGEVDWRVHPPLELGDDVAAVDVVEESRAQWTRTFDFRTISLLSIRHTGQFRPTLASSVSLRLLVPVDWMWIS